jgi:hypothetical protein
MQESLGDWPLEYGKRITERTLALFIFDSEQQIRSAAELAENVSGEFCFARYPFGEFATDHPNVLLSSDDLPALALLDRHRTTFRLIRNFSETDPDRLRYSIAAQLFDLNPIVAARIQLCSSRPSFGPTSFIFLALCLFFFLSHLYPGFLSRFSHSAIRRFPQLLRRQKETLSDT